MNKIVSNVEIFIDGVKLTESFKMNEYVYQDYIKKIECIKYSKEKVKVVAIIESDNKNTNYLVYLSLREFLLRLFVLFGNNVKINEACTNIDTNSDYIDIKHILNSPNIYLEPETILDYEKKIKESFSNSRNDGAFYNLMEANNHIDFTHRFRALFAAFDSIAPKNDPNYSINYEIIKERYADIIRLLYDGSMSVRYFEIIQELIKSDLTDLKNENHSFELKRAIKRLDYGKIIDEDVSLCILKCIQIIRNYINHGNFVKLTPKLISGAYELLLPLTKELIREALNN